MKGKNWSLVKGFCMIIAVMVMFLINTTNKANAATGSILIPVAEFTIDGGPGTDAGDFFKDFGGGSLKGGASYPCLVAPVRIPGSATKINKVIVYLEDNGIGANYPWFTLDAINKATGAADNYTYYYVTTGTTTVQAIELPLSHKGLVKGRVYQLGTCLDEEEYLYGAKVIYTVP